MFDGIKSGGLDMRRTPWRMEARKNKAEIEGGIRYDLEVSEWMERSDGN